MNADAQNKNKHYDNCAKNVGRNNDAEVLFMCDVDDAQANNHKAMLFLIFFFQFVTSLKRNYRLAQLLNHMNSTSLYSHH